MDLPDRRRGSEPGAAGLAAAAGLVPAGGSLRPEFARALNILRPYRGYNAINMIESWFNSNYQGLQTSLSKRFGKEGTLQMAYTWSKSITTTGATAQLSQNVYNWAPSWTFCARPPPRVHRVVCVSDSFARTGLVGYALGGWEVSGIVTYNSGLR